MTPIERKVLIKMAVLLLSICKQQLVRGPTAAPYAEELELWSAVEDLKNER